MNYHELEIEAALAEADESLRVARERRSLARRVPVPPAKDVSPPERAGPEG